MTDVPPPETGSPPAPEADAAPAVRPPRKRFILIGLGIGLLVIVLIGLVDQHRHQFEHRERAQCG